jgi:hypothetical protein
MLQGALISATRPSASILFVPFRLITSIFPVLFVYIIVVRAELIQILVATPITLPFFGPLKRTPHNAADPCRTRHFALQRMPTFRSHFQIIFRVCFPVPSCRGNLFCSNSKKSDHYLAPHWLPISDLFSPSTLYGSLASWYFSGSYFFEMPCFDCCAMARQHGLAKRGTDESKNPTYIPGVISSQIVSRRYDAMVYRPATCEGQADSLTSSTQWLPV